MDKEIYNFLNKDWVVQLTRKAKIEIEDKMKSEQRKLCYVGQTINYEKRMKEHIYGRKSKKNSIIDKALKKYGKDNFNFKIIDFAKTQKEADDLERNYILKYNSLKPNGYNILIGGRNQQGSWNQKKVYMYDLQGVYLSCFESSMEIERIYKGKYKRHNISDCCNGKTKRCKDRIFSYEYKDQLEPYEKPKSSRMKKVFQFDLNGNLINKFDSIQKASYCTNTSRTSIIGCAKGIYKTANGYVWSYDNSFPNREFKIQRTLIMQLDKQGNIINTFPSCKEAERKLNLKNGSYKNIYARLNKNKIAYGFYWKTINKDNHVPSL